MYYFSHSMTYLRHTVNLHFTWGRFLMACYFPRTAGQYLTNVGTNAAVFILCSPVLYYNKREWISTICQALRGWTEKLHKQTSIYALVQFNFGQSWKRLLTTNAHNWKSWLFTYLKKNIKSQKYCKSRKYLTWSNKCFGLVCALRLSPPTYWLFCWLLLLAQQELPTGFVRVPCMASWHLWISFFKSVSG